MNANKIIDIVFMKPNSQRHWAFTLISGICLAQIWKILFTPLLFIFDYHITPLGRIIIAVLMIYVFGSEISWWIHYELKKEKNIFTKIKGLSPNLKK